eukprot:scaffold451_cov365-Prasinococcus_capsulatus_cf.AAC.10
MHGQKHTAWTAIWVGACQYSLCTLRIWALLRLLWLVDVCAPFQDWTQGICMVIANHQVQVSVRRLFAHSEATAPSPPSSQEQSLQTLAAPALGVCR